MDILISNLELLLKQTKTQRISKCLEGQHTSNQLHLAGIYRALHQTHILFKTHGTFFKIDHMLSHKTNFHKCKRTEIIPGMFSEHKMIELNGSKNTTYHQCMLHSLQRFWREVYSPKWKHQTLRTFHINNFSVHLTKLEKGEQTKVRQ